MSDVYEYLTNHLVSLVTSHCTPYDAIGVKNFKLMLVEYIKVSELVESVEVVKNPIPTAQCA